MSVFSGLGSPVWFSVRPQFSGLVLWFLRVAKSSIYAAVKSGVYAYGRSLNSELEGNNVSVTVSLPGYVKTNIHKRAGLQHLTKKIPIWMWVSAEQVVKETESASIKGSSKIIPGLLYRLISIFFDLWITQYVWKIMNGRK